MLPIKTTCAQLHYCLVIMTACVMFEKKTQKNDRIVNIDKEKYEINSVMISYVRKYSLCGFRKINTNLPHTLTILIICKEKQNLI